MIAIYAIRHIPTGYYLPSPKGSLRGGSWVEPVNPTTELPRLFMTMRAAKSYLGQWLKGRFTKSWARHSSGLFGEDDYETIEVTPVPSRRREEMEIVVLSLVLPQ